MICAQRYAHRQGSRELHFSKKYFGDISPPCDAVAESVITGRLHMHMRYGVAYLRPPAQVWYYIFDGRVGRSGGKWYNLPLLPTLPAAAAVMVMNYLRKPVRFRFSLANSF
jgi:hypothetical protein